LDFQRTYCGKEDCFGEPWCSAWGLCKLKDMESQLTPAVDHNDFF